jgi:hypothetical protein
MECSKNNFKIFSPPFSTNALQSNIETSTSKIPSFKTRLVFIDTPYLINCQLTSFFLKKTIHASWIIFNFFKIADGKIIP